MPLQCSVFTRFHSGKWSKHRKHICFKDFHRRQEESSGNLLRKCNHMGSALWRTYDSHSFTIFLKEVGHILTRICTKFSISKLVHFFPKLSKKSFQTCPEKFPKLSGKTHFSIVVHSKVVHSKGGTIAPEGDMDGLS